MKPISLFVAGALFGTGLIVSGMTDANKVIGFLDLRGDWDPSLALVMVGAIVVHGLTLPRILRRPAPTYGGPFKVPTRRDLTPRLLAGSALFGAGWGLAGFCPGPALVSAAGAGTTALVFVAAMFFGMGAFHLVETLWEERRETAAETEPPEWA